MVSSLLLQIGFESLDRLAASAAKRRGKAAFSHHHPLAAYPQLRTMLHEAERSGALEAERRRLMMRRYAA